jgi:integrase
MSLSELAIKNAKPNLKPYRMNDDYGLYLEVRPTNKKVWRMRYWMGGKEGNLTLGEYPFITLKDARLKRDDARRQVSTGIKPKPPKNAAEDALPEITFASIASEWLEMQKKSSRNAKNMQTVESRINRYLLPFIGRMEPDRIQAPLLLNVIRRIESRRTIETAHRTLSVCGQIFRFAVVSGRATRDPSSDLKGALQTRKPTHFASITDSREAGALMRACENYTGSLVVQIALKMSALTFTRPREIRHAEWSEINLGKNEWRIAAEKMKMKRPHIIPLSRQAVEVLGEIYPATGHGRYIFPSYRAPGGERPMSEAAITAALRRMGYSKEEMTAHGFRAMASTALYENGWPGDAIERQLAHVESNSVKAAYSHAQFMDVRRKIMQWWADYLDELRDGV